MRVAAVDFGSNSFLCLIAELSSSGQLVEVYDTIEYVKLAEGVHRNKAFSPAALSRADEAMSKFRKIIDEYNVDKIVSVATSAARDVTNKEEFFKLGEKHKIPIKVITGNGEGDLTYLGVLSGKNTDEPFAVLDIGGGSTEIAYKKNGEFYTKSFNIGCVRLTELFLKSAPESDDEIAAFQKYLNGRMDPVDNGNLEIMAVAGTPTTLASLHLEKDFDPAVVNNFKLEKKHIENLIEKLRKLTVEERKELPGIDAPRADVIMAGALILNHVLGVTKQSHVVVSTRGVRYGLAYKALKGIDI